MDLNNVFTPEFEERLKRLMGERQVPGCSIALVRRNSTANTWEELIKIYGTARDDQPVSSKTRFPIASNTKLFTVLALSKLLEENDFTFDTKIKDIVPEFKLVDKVAEARLSVADVCAHVSGVPGYNLGYKKGQTKFDIFKLFEHLAPSTEFRGGKSHQYSNMGYDLLGYIVEHLSKDTYRDYIWKNILEPLGMKTAGFSPDENTAKGYRCDIEEYFAQGSLSEVDMDVLGDESWDSSGGLIASAEDMVQWMKAFPTLPGYTSAAKPRSFDPSWGERWNYPYSSAVPTYGAGLYQMTYNGTSIQEHWGSLCGYRALTLWIEDVQLGLRVMTNGAAGEDVVNLIKMVVLEEYTEGKEVGLDEWVRRIELERAAKTARDCSDYRAISSTYPESPISGTFVCPGFPVLRLDETNFMNVRPNCVTLPFRPQLYGNLRPILCNMGNGRYEACFELTMAVDGRKSFGLPFHLQVEEGGKDRFEIFGLSGVGYGVDGDQCPAIFVRV
ncbi:hypothetical protein V865_001891 [Kwoniella europaea PYCC6329]|uniref:Beta-lactamase-related domain-containing protein n=1 Tax=Kwoniella europaea PYCC6329 TaxID=1423913 RepID=A0AAX4KE82_9TREE